MGTQINGFSCHKTLFESRMIALPRRIIYLSLWLYWFECMIQNDWRKGGMYVFAQEPTKCNRSAINSQSEIVLAVGDILMLSCLTDNGVSENNLTWYKDDIAFGVDAITENGGRFASTITDNDDACTEIWISISDVQETDGGIYVCSGPNTDVATVNVTVCPGVPQCSWSLTSEHATELFDTIDLKCEVCQKFLDSLPHYTLSWTRHEGMNSTEVGNSTSWAASAVIDIQTALDSRFTCTFKDLQKKINLCS